MNNEQKVEFVEGRKQRFKQYVIRSTKLYQGMPVTGEAKIFGNQFLRSASSAGANYRSACRARSAKEFFAKMSIVVEELDESCFWMEIITETEILPESKTRNLMNEANELLSICAKARKNTFN